MATQITRWLANDGTYHETWREAEDHETRCRVMAALRRRVPGWVEATPAEVVDALFAEFEITPKSKDDAA